MDFLKTYVSMVVSDKSQKGLPLETKYTQNHENRRLGLILICNTVVCDAPA